MTMEQVQTLEKNETKLIGYSVTVSLNQDLENGIVGRLREELIGNRHKITNQLDDNGIYLIQVYPDCEWTPDVPFESIVAVEVSDFVRIPEGFISHTIPAGSYVKVTYKGPESEIGETYDLIRKKGIAECRPFDFEYWTDINSLDQEDCIIDIYLPL
jgi:predicted transcriptional regulator YdeE